MDKENIHSVIRLTNNIIITNDGLNYTLQKVSTSKKGTQSQQIIGHYGSLGKAVIAAEKYFVRLELSKIGEMDLDEAVSVIVRSNNYFASLVKNAFEGVTT